MPHILLVEDDRWLAELYAAVLREQSSYEVSVAYSASDGLTKLSVKEKVDLIILDMLLPDHNGIEFLHEAASYEDLNATPIIVLSSVYEHDFHMHPRRWEQYGVIDYLYKPTTKPAALLARVKKHFAQTKSKAQL